MHLMSKYTYRRPMVYRYSSIVAATDTGSSSGSGSGTQWRVLLWWVVLVG